MSEKTRAGLAGIVAFALLVVGASDAFAEVKTFSMQAATSYSNGDPLPQSDVAHYAIECSRDGGTQTEVGQADPVELELAVDFQVDGGYTCTAFTVLTSGVRSGPSNAVFFTIARSPSAPVLSVD